MYRSPPASQDTHDDHVRTLLDQRSARADVHGRFSTISEYMDTPSVYSRPNFSPRPSDNGDHRILRSDYDYASPTSPLSDGTHIHDQSTSMLDLDDDPRSSLALSESYDDEQLTYEGGGDDLEIATRISYLGPKMRFHSRAPWEIEGDALEEEDESEQIPRHFPPAYPFSRSNGSKPDSSRSSSPRPSFKSRPSGESSRSQLPPKRSFDTINSQVSYSRGALYALAQESLSTNSLARAAVPAKETLRSKFSFGRLRPEVPTVPLPPSPIRARFPSSSRGSEQPSFESPSRFNNTHYVNKSHVESNETMHPYANPDLVVSYAEDESANPTSDYAALPRNDSNITVTESFSTDSIMKSSSRSTLTPDTSLNSITSKHRTSSVLSKKISSPVPVVGPPQQIDPVGLDNHSINSIPPTISGLPGWTERNSAPTFSLISLEEARAQRTRSSTVTVPSRVSTSSGLSSSSAQFPTGDIENINNVQISDPTGHANSSRARGRSISAGARAKNVIHTIVGQQKPEHRESEPFLTGYQSPSGTPTGKTVRHKKSGFMRLFNGGKIPEKEERMSPPPVPSLPDTVINPQPIQRTSKSAVHRIPVPSLSPALLEASTSTTQIAGSPQSDSDSWKTNPSPKRTPPPLSINTIPHGLPSRSSTSQMHLGVLERPWLSEQPQSAPAHVSEFPALRLRPVSTLFSSQFGDHIVTGDSRSSDETSDLDTPRSQSPNGLMSPITPASFTRNDQKIQISASSAEDRASIKNLQEQLISSKKAWQRHIWELEGQVRDLKVELDEIKDKNKGEYCQSCGRGNKQESLVPASAGISIVNRPRARTGTSSRFGNALP